MSRATVKPAPEKLQEEYYIRTASAYDEMHAANENGEHYTALKLIDALRNSLGLRTFLDVGAGTGRGVRFFSDRGLQAWGVEPVMALIQEAERRGVPKGIMVGGTGYSLPFGSNSIDAVFECGVLHHVAEPSRVVDEMTRVARKAVFLSDANRFGQGGLMARILKLLLYKTRLWRTARFIQTKGKVYTISEGDGLAYSYSVFDSYDQLAAWADLLWLIPTTGGEAHKSWFHPLLTSPHVLLCAIRNGD